MMPIETPTTEMVAFQLPALPDDAAELFRDASKMEAHLNVYRNLVAESDFDVDTAQGRGAAKSIAVVDTERRKMRETMDELRDEAKADALEWEAREKTRVDALETRLIGLLQIPPLGAGSSEIADWIEAKTDEPLDETWEEFLDRATAAKAETLAALENMLTEAKRREAEQAELAALREAAAARLEADKAAAAAAREAALKAAQEAEMKRREDAAAEKAKADAEQAVIAAKAAQIAAEKAKEAAEAKAAQEAKDAAERAKAQAALAVEAERQRAAAERAAKAAADEKALAQKKRRAKIKADISNAIVPLVGQAKTRAGLGDLVAEEIMAGRIPWGRIEL
jgi:hypothetical protein